MTSPFNNAVWESTDFSGFALRWLLAAILVLSVPGCKRSPDSAPVNAAQSADSPELTAALKDLTQALRQYALEHRGLPKTFSELSAAGYVKSPPTAPAGQKFEIDFKTSRVVLVNQ